MNPNRYAAYAARLRDGLLPGLFFGCSGLLTYHYGNGWILLASAGVVAVPFVLWKLHMGQGFVGYYRKLGWGMLWLILYVGYTVTLLVWTMAVYW